MNQFWFAIANAFCDVSSLLNFLVYMSFPLLYLESVAKSNVTVFVYTQRKQKKKTISTFLSFCLRANGPVNYKWTGPLKQSMIFLSYIMIWCSQFIGSSD